METAIIEISARSHDIPSCHKGPPRLFPLNLMGKTGTTHWNSKLVTRRHRLILTWLLTNDSRFFHPSARSRFFPLYLLESLALVYIYIYIWESVLVLLPDLFRRNPWKRSSLSRSVVRVDRKERSRNGRSYFFSNYSVVVSRSEPCRRRPWNLKNINFITSFDRLRII